MDNFQTLMLNYRNLIEDFRNINADLQQKLKKLKEYNPQASDSLRSASSFDPLSKPGNNAIPVS